MRACSCCSCGHDHARLPQTMVHGKRCARGRRGPRARHAGDSRARGRAPRPGASGNSPALHFGPGESGRQPRRSPLAQSHGHLGQLRLAGLREAGPDARFPSRDRASLRAGSPQLGLGGARRGSSAASAARVAAVPTAPSPPCPRPAPTHGRPGTGGHGGLLQLPAPCRSESAAPAGRAPTARGDRSLGNPVSLPQRAWEFPKGLYLVLAAGNQVFGAGTAQGQFWVSVSSYLGAASLGGGGVGRIKSAELEIPDPGCALDPCRDFMCARSGLPVRPGGAGASGLPPAAMQPT